MNSYQSYHQHQHQQLHQQQHQQQHPNEGDDEDVSRLNDSENTHHHNKNVMGSKVGGENTKHNKSKETDSTGIIVGGSIDDEPAYCLLAGIVEDSTGSPAGAGGGGGGQHGEVDIRHFPIRRLPATLGRTHAGGDINFVPLGCSKALSRNHCLIYYRDVNGGTLESKTPGTIDDGEDDNELIYHPKKKFKTEEGDQKESKEDDPEDASNIINSHHCSDDRQKDPSLSAGDMNSKKKSISLLPATGFFAVQCLGKNKIIVGGRAVQKGQVALLQHGTTLQIASHKLYFLLPKTKKKKKKKKKNKDGKPLVSSGKEKKEKTMEIPNPAYEKYTKTVKKKKLKQSLTSSTAPAAAAGPSHRPDREPSLSSVSTGAAVAAAKPQKIQSSISGMDLESVPVETLLATMNEAIESDQWNKRLQMVGTAISLHAVRDSARSKEMRAIAKKEGGVARADVMKWIRENPLYSTWVDQMLSKMELKSYQSNIGKALSKTGFLRTGTTGRHVRWALPRDLLPPPSDDDSGGGDDDDDDNDDDDNDEDNNNDEEEGKNDGEDDEEEDDEEEDHSHTNTAHGGENSASSEEDHDDDDNDDDEEERDGNDVNGAASSSSSDDDDDNDADNAGTDVGGGSDDNDDDNHSSSSSSSQSAANASMDEADHDDDDDDDEDDDDDDAGGQGHAINNNDGDDSPGLSDD